MDEEQPVPEAAAIQPKADNLVCPQCGSSEVECLDWVRVNDNYFIGGNESMPADDYWCPDCQVHEKPVYASDFCEEKGHSGQPCSICGHSGVAPKEDRAP
jgi:predicted RNA-binding Zn-ribbon protein involved in translation (DUF1610 family)